MNRDPGSGGRAAPPAPPPFFPELPRVRPGPARPRPAARLGLGEELSAGTELEAWRRVRAPSETPVSRREKLASMKPPCLPGSAARSIRDVTGVQAEQSIRCTSVQLAGRKLGNAFQN